MFDIPAHETRILMEADMVPAQGHRFQPTGFPDIGAATYTLPDDTRMLLVESAQSMANRLEQTVIGPDGELVPELKGLAYVRAHFSGDSDATTNSLLEAHRINSPFIISDKGFQARFVELAAYAKGKPMDWHKVAIAVLHFDPGSLLHGLFLANVEDGRLRLPRLLSAFIEARDVREAVSGGVKNNPIDPSGTLRVASLTKDVYGNVPYHRTEFTAASITAYFNFDLGQLRGYRLGPDAEELLLSLGLLKVRRFLSSGTRLRTACDLRLARELRVTAPAKFVLPSEPELLQRTQRAIAACAPLMATPPITDLNTLVKDTRAKADKGGA